MIIGRAWRRRSRNDILIVLVFVLLFLYFRSSPSFLYFYISGTAPPSSSIPRVVHQFAFPEGSVPDAHMLCVRGTLTKLNLLIGTDDKNVEEHDMKERSPRTCALAGVSARREKLSSNNEQDLSSTDGFEYYSWSVDAMLAFVEDHKLLTPQDPRRKFYELLDHLHSPLQVADVARYLLLYELGGAFLNTGLEPLNVLTAQSRSLGPHDQWAHHFPCVLVEEANDGVGTSSSKAPAAPSISTSVLACRPRHPFFELVLSTLSKLVADASEHEFSQQEQLQEAREQRLSDADVAGEVPGTGTGRGPEGAIDTAFRDEDEVREALAHGEGTGARFLGLMLARYRAALRAAAQCSSSTSVSSSSTPSSADCVQVFKMSVIQPKTSEPIDASALTRMRVLKCSNATLSHQKNGLSILKLNSLLKHYCSYIKNRGFVYS